MSFDFGLSSPQEADPTADFLKREQDRFGSLGGDDADLFSSGGNNAAPGTLAAGSAGPAGDVDFDASKFPSLDGEDDAPSSATAAAAVAPPKDDFESKFPTLDDDEPVGASAGAGAGVGLDDDDANGFLSQPAAPSSTAPYSSSAAPASGLNNSSSNKNNNFGNGTYNDDADEESDALRQWRDKRADEIAARDAAAERKKGETISKAEREIDDFYAEYNRKKEKNISANKEAEARTISERQAELAEGTTWSRITKLIDLQNPTSKTILNTSTAKNPLTGQPVGDLTRMKDLLLGLRREGDKAPAAGY